MRDRFVFRKATNQDSPQIRDLVIRCLAEYGMVYSPDTSESDLKDIESTYLSDLGTFLIIVDPEKDKVIGTIALLRLSKETGKLRKLYVDKSHRGLGLGRRLTLMILEDAKKLGLTKVVLETVSSMSAAIRLYEDLGFERAKHTKALSPRCDLVMFKQL